MSENIEAPELWVSFDAPAMTRVVLQGEALKMYQEYLVDESDMAEDEFVEALRDQLLPHIEAWTSIDEWSEVK
jgi:hypothetical protein